MEWTLLDRIWVTGIVLVNVLFFARKAILANHGHPFSPFNMFLKDFGKMQEVIKKEPNPKVRLRYKIMNYGISVLFVSSVFGLIVSKIILKSR